jgi:bifunctional DNase/RNase
LVIALAFRYGIPSYIAVEVEEDDEKKVEEAISEKVIE